MGGPGFPSVERPAAKAWGHSQGSSVPPLGEKWATPGAHESEWHRCGFCTRLLVLPAPLHPQVKLRPSQASNLEPRFSRGQNISWTEVTDPCEGKV